MKKRIYYAIGAIALFFGVGALLDFGITTEDHLANYVRRVERSLHKKESEVYTLMADTGFIYRQLRGIAILPSAQQDADLSRLLQLSVKKYNLSMYRGDSLVFWLNNSAFLDTVRLRRLQQQGGAVTELVRLPNGYFELIKKDLPDGVTAIALLPIKREYAKESEFLPNVFETDDFPIPRDVVLRQTKTDFPIRTISGQELAWLDATGPAKDKKHLQLVFLIYVLGFVALGVLVNDLAVVLVRRFQPWVGAAFMLTSVIVIRWVTVELGFTKHFSDFQTFSKVFTDPILEGVNSLGELLINIILLVWMMVFFNREFLVKEFVNPSRAIRFALTTLNFFAINLGILMVASIIKSIVLDSSIVFDFEDVFNLNSQSILAMIGVVLLLLALFLFSHRMMTAIHKIGMGKYWRLAALALALIFTIPVIQLGNLELPLTHFLAAAVLYLVVFEFFIEVRNMTLGWLVGWLMLYAGLTSLLLYKYNNDKDLKRRAGYARALADYEDPFVVDVLDGVIPYFTSPEAVKQWNRLLDEFPGDAVPEALAKDIFEERLDDNKYIHHNYHFDLFAFNQLDGSPVLHEQTATLGEMESAFHRGRPTKNPHLMFIPEESRVPGYLLRINVPAKEPLTVFARFKRDFSTPSKVYTELLLVSNYKQLDELDDYDYGIYQDGQLIESRNRLYGKHLTDEVPEVGKAKVIKHTSRRSELLYHAPANIVIKIGKDTGGYIKPLSLFSYVFGMLAVAVLLFGGINYLTNALPGPLNFMRTTKPSLRNHFQIWIILMILFSFFGIGFVTVWYFQQSSNNYHKGRLDRKVTSALANVNYEISAWQREGRYDPEKWNLSKNQKQEHNAPGVYQPWNDKINAQKLASLIPLISEVHRLDVNIYDLDGDLITSSEKDIFKRGLIAPKMGTVAFQQLVKLGYERSDQQESIGNLEYTAAYLPLKNLNGETLAIMGIPYYARQRELRSDVTDFMSTLLNVYVFLLLIAGGLSMVIANRVTKHLSTLRENLGKLQLGGNQRLTYSRNDEIGDLVKAYNDAAQKIEESSRLLAQRERDDAWREMAKQVAHEIKNPLTPMKLSIQYLLHTYQTNPKEAEPLLKRVTKTLIEQIDTLANIASEFSNFAKMPKAENSAFSINDLTASVHHLFANERTDMDITLSLPDDDLEVFADRNHLTRVLNNLLKNAIQAIPDNIRGKIEVSLFQKDHKAIIRVKDNGTGIPPEIQKKVFTPNFSTKTSGTGLGLAICKS
ncbi:MAG TPA: sensor histidine kinase, partial [Bacteroidetes bacterium]|nr:sensor histidine kinase [Bacteroidota bacterium]